MRERHYPDGKVIYREGDPGGAVYVIKSGKVEVLRSNDAGSMILGTLERGGIFGEMSVILDQPHSTTTRARTPLKLLEVRRKEFLAAFGGDNTIALPLLRMLCTRLSDADRRLMERTRSPEGAAVANVDRVRLMPATSIVEKQIGKGGIVVTQFPFKVGRRAMPTEPPRITDSQVALMASDFSNLSIEQFAIEELNGRLVVRDLESENGTLVNSVRASQYERSATLSLLYGENLVIAGSLESPIGFRILVDPRDK